MGALGFREKPGPGAGVRGVGVSPEAVGGAAYSSTAGLCPHNCSFDSWGGARGERRSLPRFLMKP